MTAKAATSKPTALRQRMIDDMSARKLGPHSQRSHLSSCRRFALWLGRSPETASADEVKAFQLHLIEDGASICNRNRIMTGVKFLLKVTMRRHDLAAEIHHLREPQKVPLVMSLEEIKRVLAMAPSLQAHMMLTLAYGCGLRAGEVTRLKVGDIDSAQNIIRIVQAQGRKDRNVMLPADVLSMLRDWWRERPTRYDGALRPHGDRNDRRHRQPARSDLGASLFQERAEERGAIGWRPAPLWRSPTSSALMDPPGVTPIAAMSASASSR